MRTVIMKPHTGQFKPGVSGNPGGRPPGKNNVNLMEKALREYGKDSGVDIRQTLITTIIEQGLQGCIMSQKMVLDRLIPSLKPTIAPINIAKLPNDIGKKADRILELATSGEISVDVTKDLLSGISVLLKAKEQADILARLEKLENEHH